MSKTALIILGVIILVILLGAGYYFYAGGNVSEQQLQVLRERIRHVSNTQATRLEQCHVMPMGSKACGGPTGYVVYSSETTDEERLKNVVDEYTELQEQRNAEQNAVSDCMVLPKPEAVLEDGRCTTNSPLTN